MLPCQSPSRIVHKSVALNGSTSFQNRGTLIDRVVFTPTFLAVTGQFRTNAPCPVNTFTSVQRIFIKCLQNGFAKLLLHWFQFIVLLSNGQALTTVDQDGTLVDRNALCQPRCNFNFLAPNGSDAISSSDMGCQPVPTQVEFLQQHLINPWLWWANIAQRWRPSISTDSDRYNMQYIPHIGFTDGCQSGSVFLIAVCLISPLWINQLLTFSQPSVYISSLCYLWLDDSQCHMLKSTFFCWFPKVHSRRLRLLLLNASHYQTQCPESCNGHWFSCFQQKLFWQPKKAASVFLIFIFRSS